MVLAAGSDVEQDEDREDTEVEAETETEALPVETELSEDAVEDVRAVVGAAFEVV